MGFEQIQQFCSSPQLPDIIAYVLFLISLLTQYFVKKYVNRDNLSTKFKVDEKVAKLMKLQDKLNVSNESHHKDVETFMKEKDVLLGEIKLLKDALKVILVNNQDLVKNGVASEVAKMLQLDGETIITEVKVEEIKSEPSSEAKSEVTND